MAFLTKWRVITAYLLDGHNTMANPAFEGNINRAVKDLVDIVREYELPEENAARLSNLKSITRLCAKLALTLFSLPAFCEFDWAHEGGGLVVFPALLRMTDENGRRAAPPYPLKGQGQEVVA